MRFIKPIVILVIIGVIVAFIWQNLPTLTAPQHFALSFGFGEPLTTAPPNACLLATAAIVGFVLGIVVMLKPLQNARKKLAQERQEKQETKTA
jgi:chromate transport protein ChrA